MSEITEPVLSNAPAPLPGVVPQKPAPPEKSAEERCYQIATSHNPIAQQFSLGSVEAVAWTSTIVFDEEGNSETDTLRGMMGSFQWLTEARLKKFLEAGVHTFARPFRGTTSLRWEIFDTRWQKAMKDGGYVGNWRTDPLPTDIPMGYFIWCLPLPADTVRGHEVCPFPGGFNVVMRRNEKLPPNEYRLVRQLTPEQESSLHDIQGFVKRLDMAREFGGIESPEFKRLERMREVQENSK